MISRRQAGERLRRLADRIDHHGAPKVTNWTFTFEPGQGPGVPPGRTRLPGGVPGR
jgi:hypothetical protein